MTTDDFGTALAQRRAQELARERARDWHEQRAGQKRTIDAEYEVLDEVPMVTHETIK